MYVCTFKSPTPDATPTSSKTTPQRPHVTPTSSPVLSIYDLERRFHKKPNLLQDQRQLPPRKPQPSAIASPQYTAIAHLLHAIADLLGCHNSSHIHDIRNPWPICVALSHHESVPRGSASMAV